MTVETHTSPPEPNVDDTDEDQPGARLSIHLLTVDQTHYDAGTQVWGAQASDPEWFAGAVVAAALGLAGHLGPDHYWATLRRLTAFDGSSSR